eukprot:TRINITY_DN782034_c0_g1_i1.p1 TRINITY_DN782034_c0_g1~~TRINITY_DN782034_c0_g1_i1.p1  ORF type:complete len:425 (+),score=111.08 TRINITY_DN782034_c0_g1_i1:187-1461(+)
MATATDLVFRDHQLCGEFFPKKRVAHPRGTDASRSKVLSVKTEQYSNLSSKDETTKSTISSTALVELKGTAPSHQNIPDAIVEIQKTRERQVPIPQFHKPWKLHRVFSGHLGWVRAIAVEPGNEWFATGSADRTIKIWDLASGGLKLTLTGHISTLRGLQVSSRHPYLFSASEDKTVKCWDLEYNKVIRSYHGHLSGVYSLALHPTIDVLISGGRDSVARVWDIRTKQQVQVLGGHSNTVCSIATQGVDPQIITGSMDAQIKLWDLAAGRAMTTLTNHKKGVRALALHPREFTFVSGAHDNIKKWHCKDGTFLQNLSGHDSIVNTLALNDQNVLVSGADDGSMHFWDYKTGYCFQKTETISQPGSLECEAGIFASTFDKSGSRLLTCEADKTIKVWKEDDSATPETHPVDMKAWTKTVRSHKRF